MADRTEGLAEELNPRQGWNKLTGAPVLVDNRILRDQPDVYTDIPPTPAEPAPVE